MQLSTSVSSTISSTWLLVSIGGVGMERIVWNRGKRCTIRLETVAERKTDGGWDGVLAAAVVLSIFYPPFRPQSIFLGPLDCASITIVQWLWHGGFALLMHQWWCIAPMCHPHVGPPPCSGCGNVWGGRCGIIALSPLVFWLKFLIEQRYLDRVLLHWILL